jgi:two-component system, NarL family, sensor histidine kinase UhpB
MRGAQQWSGDRIWMPAGPHHGPGPASAFLNGRAQRRARLPSRSQAGIGVPEVDGDVTPLWSWAPTMMILEDKMSSRHPSNVAESPGRPRYTPLIRKVAATNALVLLVACLLTILVLSPHKIASFATDEAVLLGCALAVVIAINVLLLRRAFAPLGALIALARRVDLTRPGQRVPVERRDSEASELALSFNEMLIRLEAERRDSTRGAIAAQEAERLRVARELHDEVGQTLTAVLLQLARVLKRAPDDLKGELADVQEVVRASLDDVRRISIELRPEALDDFGLASALVALTDRLRERTGLQLTRQIEPWLPDLDREAELVVYRVAQEALTNIVRHAETDHAELSLKHHEDRLTLIVRDHGIGINAVLVNGTGMQGMRERAALVWGKLAVHSPMDGGTEVRLDLPLKH